MKSSNIKINNGGIYINDIKLNLENIVVKSIIGKGANGIVFYCIDEILNREVAVKIWVQKNNDSRNKLKQGLHEARKISALKHENIVTAYTAQIHNKHILSLTTEYLNGETLRNYLRRSPSLNSRIGIWNKIADAMVYAHRHSIYHGDLHSKNVMIISEKPIIIDFGTSFFSKTQKDSKKRECDLITKLAIEIFPEWNELHLNVNAIYGYPEMALNQCIKWVHFNEHYKRFLQRLEKYSDEEDHYFIKNEIGQIGFAIARSPSIKRIPVLRLLQKHNPPEWLIKEFLHGCIAITKLELMDDPEPVVVRGVDKEKDIKQLFNEFDKLAKKLMSKYLLLCENKPVKYLKKVL